MKHWFRIGIQKDFVEEHQRKVVDSTIKMHFICRIRTIGHNLNFEVIFRVIVAIGVRP